MARTGVIGEQIYEQVEEMMSSGRTKTRTEAFSIISNESGRREGTVAANYYRVARREAGNKPSNGRRRGNGRNNGNGDGQEQRQVERQEPQAQEPEAQVYPPLPATQAYKPVEAMNVEEMAVFMKRMIDRMAGTMLEAENAKARAAAAEAKITRMQGALEDALQA